MDPFCAVTTITIRNGKLAFFWDSPWLHGVEPKDVAHLIYATSTRKKCTVKQAMTNNASISKIKIDANLTIPHIHEYIRLWVLLNNIHLHKDTDDTIIWNLTASGDTLLPRLIMPNSSKPRTIINMNKLMWKAWAPPKIKCLLG
jgi:hypothetical protein